MRAGLLGLLALLGPAVAVAAPPVTNFTNFARYESMKISPNGKYLALTRRTTEHEVMTVLHFPELKLSTQAHFGDLTDIASFEWANDQRLLIAPSRRFPGFTDFKAPTGEIIGFDVTGKGAKLLFGYQAGAERAGTRVEQTQPMDFPAEVMSRLPGNPAEVLIQTYGYGIKGAFNSAYRMNVNDGRLRKLADSPIRDGTFLTDQDYRVTLVAGEDWEGNNQVFYRPTGSDEWRRLVSTAQYEGTLWPVATAAQKGEFQVLDDRETLTNGVYDWAPETGALRLLYRNPDVTVRPEGLDPAGKVWAYEYVDHFPGYWYPVPDHPLAQIHQWLRGLFRDHVVEITSQTDDMSLAVARVSAPRTPPTFFVVDVKERKLVVQLAARPDLKPEDLASVDPFEFNARDGMKIRGYVTMPPGPRKKQLPMIVLVHGGPFSVFDRYDFNYETQLLASRGYAVLQVNFRGSGGRGRSFVGAGYARWGREMQDDITDGVRWAIGDGVADPKRICIFGTSYGGYAALAGAFREPEQFRCAVGMSGVYDLPLMFEKGDIQTVESGLNYMKTTIGTDMEELKRRSPVYNADKIRTPVLLLHGKIDERVPFEHAKRMRDALEKAGNPPEWYTEWGEAHGFDGETNRAAAYERILGFFAKHLGEEGGP